MVDKRQQTRTAAQQLYNSGNAAIRAERYAEAIALYSEAIALDPQLPMAFHNRAIAYSKIGNESACIEDFLAAMTMNYDTVDFWNSFFASIWPNTLIELLARNDLSAALRERIRSRAEEAIQRSTFFLQTLPNSGMQFSSTSLPHRFMLAKLTSPQAIRMNPDDFRRIFDLCVDSDNTRDDEFAWRAKFMIATVLYERYGTMESPLPSGGVDMDMEYYLYRPLWHVGEAALQAAVFERMPARENEPLKSHLARFTMALARDAAEIMLRRRVAEPPPPGSAGMNWYLAEFVFMLLIRTAEYLDDPQEVLRSITLARQFNASVAVTSWAGSRHQHRELLTAIMPSVDPVSWEAGGQAPLPPFALPATILIEYFTYEAGADNLIRACITPTDSRVTRRYLSESEMFALLGLGLQWQDPASFAELADDPGISPMTVVAHSMFAAITDVPDESYDDWLDELLFGPGILEQMGDCHRLVLIPYNYLHNMPFHLLPEVQRRIDAGQIDEVVVSPSLPLSRRLAARTPVARGTASCLFVGINSAEIDADAECAAVRRSFQRIDDLLDDNATPGRVLEVVANYDVIHFACHGEFDVRQNTGYLLLANHERLYPADLVLAPGLRADLVVLNACVSGVASREARQGDQGLGLATALLYGGARQVIGTLWQVDSEAAVDFASTFYPEWRASTDSTASIVLRTQRKLRDKFPYIFSWGAHAVFGDWR